MGVLTILGIASICHHLDKMRKKGEYNGQKNCFI
ncbi:hypothetical protein cce_2153 [Crocosphaera subtropica ATCC 51142]|uniref:Uncharacterized protein n=1 Tax=Crocosphaera subtropica (strain ATCC 51142 / BH68) TaxID=43989 RepID=B1WNS4_CROS5|nr:hypothetical protein cce_2153 [Crocosphaera subtropica ATCC 51142]